MSFKNLEPKHRTQERQFSQRAAVAGLSLLVSGLIAYSGLTWWNARVPVESNGSAVGAGQQGLPLSFEANQGQADSEIKFLSRGKGYSLLLTETEAILKLSSGRRTRDDRASSWVRMQHVSSNPEPRVEGSDLTAAKSHYFLGNDPRAWRANIPHYAKVSYKEVYRGVDLAYYGHQGQLEYDYLLAPGADPNVITLAFQGADGLSIDAAGDLLIAAGSGALCFKKPRAYQWSEGSARTVQSAYRMKGDHQIGFELGAYDPSLPLVIDPVLTYSTYLGGSEDDRGLGIAVDGEGNTYVTGVTQSANFPQSGSNTGTGGEDVFVSKLNPAGSALIYSAYLGGSAADVARALVVDAAGNVYVLGGTRSTNFPASPGAFQTTLRGASDVFVLKLNPVGNQLEYSTYLGGTREEGFEGGGLAVNAAGQVFVTGVTDSPDFPTSRVTFQRSFGGGTSDAFVSKLASDGARLVYSTYLGGFDLDQGRGIAVDGADRIYVTGRTRSPNLVNHNAYQVRRLSTLDDAFLTKFNPLGDLVTYSTFLGGSGNEAAHGIAVNDTGLAYLVGETDSTDLVTTSDAFKKEHGGSDLDGFIAKLRTTVSRSGSLAYSSFFGGTGNDAIRALAVGPTGAVHITGVTDSSDFPTTDAAQSQFGGGSSDAFAAKLNSLGTGLVYSTYLGGAGADSGEAIAILARFPGRRGVSDFEAGNTFVAGITESNNFPTAAPLQPRTAGKKDVFVSRIPDGNGSPVALTLTAGITFSYPTGSTTPIPPPQVAQTLTATFTVTNRGGRTAFLGALTLLENDPGNDVPNYPPARNVVIEPGDSYRFTKGIVLTRTGTFNFKAAFQTPASNVWQDIPAAEGSTSQVDVTVANTNNNVGPVQSIEVTANPCEIPFGKTTCTIDITWVAVNAEAPQLRVQDVGIGGPESLFSTDASGKATINWIQGPPHKYKFTLYDVGGGTQRELGFMEMTAKEGNPPVSRGTLKASPNPCEIPAGAATCTTSITWTTSDLVPYAILYVEDIGFGHPRSGVEAGKARTVELGWIQAPPHRYIFTLFEVSATGQVPITSIEVIGKEASKPAAPSGTISAAPNPCVIPADGTTCSTVVSWNTTSDVSDARVVVTDVGVSGTPVLLAAGKSGSVTYGNVEASPHKYVFTLYGSISNRLVELGSVEASGAKQ
jgi:Beta-propeller repeat